MKIVYHAGIHKEYKQTRKPRKNLYDTLHSSNTAHMAVGNRYVSLPRNPCAAVKCFSVQQLITA